MTQIPLRYNPFNIKFKSFSINFINLNTIKNLYQNLLLYLSLKQSQLILDPLSFINFVNLNLPQHLPSFLPRFQLPNLLQFLLQVPLSLGYINRALILSQSTKNFLLTPRLLNLLNRNNTISTFFNNRSFFSSSTFRLNSDPFFLHRLSLYFGLNRRWLFRCLNRCWVLKARRRG